MKIYHVGELKKLLSNIEDNVMLVLYDGRRYITPDIGVMYCELIICEDFYSLLDGEDDD